MTAISNDKPLNWRLLDAITDGDLPLVNHLLNLGADPTFDDSQPIILACREGHLNILQRLEEAGGNVRATDLLPDVGLGYACRYGHLNVVRYLLTRNANVDANDWWGAGAPLYWSIREGHEAITTVLLDAGANVNARDGALVRMAETLGSPAMLAAQGLTGQPRIAT